MKKILSILLVAAFALTMSLTVLAEGLDGETGDVNVIIDKTGLNPDDNDPDNPKNPVYSVTIEWGNLDFTYKYSSLDWDPDTHTYPGNWDHTSATIKVTNHSNAGINVNATFPSSAASAEKNGVKATLSGNSFSLNSAVDTAVDAAPNNTATVAITGAPTVTDQYKIDTITVALSAK